MASPRSSHAIGPGSDRACVLKWPRMDRVGKVFRSFREADAADDQFYADMSPKERLDLLLELIERHRSDLGEAASRFQRVHRIVELERR